MSFDTFATCVEDLGIGFTYRDITWEQVPETWRQAFPATEDMAQHWEVSLTLAGKKFTTYFHGGGMADCTLVDVLYDYYSQKSNYLNYTRKELSQEFETEITREEWSFMKARCKDLTQFLGKGRNQRLWYALQA